MTGRIRFLLLDDLDHVRDSLRAVIELEPTWEVVGAAADGPSGLGLAAHLGPDIIVLDADLPGTKLDELVPRLKALVTVPRIVVMTIHEAPEWSGALLTAIDLCIAKDAGVTGMLSSLTALLGQSPAPARAS